MSGGLVERHDERMAGVLSSYDRIVITGTLPSVCHARGMTAFLYANAIRIFDYPQFAARCVIRSGKCGEARRRRGRCHQA